MPMDFPDMPSLIRAAFVWKFRQPLEGESEDAYRQALADHVQPEDLVESMEIRTKRGWNKFTAEQNRDMLQRVGIKG